MSITPKILKAERNATLSSCCGLTGEACLTDSAVIILFANLLGAGSMLSVMTTAILPFLNGVLLIPLAGMAVLIGSRRLVLGANMAALCGYFLVILSPFFSGYEVFTLLLGLAIFATCQSGFVAGWFPLLDSFLLPQRRIFFLGRMRFFHQLSAVTFLTLVSILIGKSPNLFYLQLALLGGAMAFSGRLWFIWRMPVFSDNDTSKALKHQSLKKIISNPCLNLFNIYMLLFNLAVFCVIPITILHLKNQNIGDNKIVFISAIAFVGMMFGYFFAARLIKFVGEFIGLLSIHIIVAITIITIWILVLNNVNSLILLAPLLFLLNLCIATNSVVVNGAMMKFAIPENRCMLLAYAGTFYYGGAGFSRILGAMGSFEVVLLLAAVLALIGCVLSPKLLIPHPLRR